jgi:ABC-type glycerol-3-phosphate transport system permease component
MERFKYLMSRFGMIIPFVVTIICLLISKSAGEPHASNARIAMWVFLGLFTASLSYWVVRQVIEAVRINKEINDAEE